MLGRKEELNHLNELYNSDCFEYLVMYGRRRVGKTTILQEFAEHSNAIFFSALEKNDALNFDASIFIGQVKHLEFDLIRNQSH